MEICILFLFNLFSKVVWGTPYNIISKKSNI